MIKFFGGSSRGAARSRHSSSDAPQLVGLVDGHQRQHPAPRGRPPGAAARRGGGWPSGVSAITRRRRSAGSRCRSIRPVGQQAGHHVGHGLRGDERVPREVGGGQVGVALQDGQRGVLQRGQVDRAGEVVEARPHRQLDLLHQVEQGGGRATCLAAAPRRRRPLPPWSTSGRHRRCCSGEPEHPSRVALQDARVVLGRDAELLEVGEPALRRDQRVVAAEEHLVVEHSRALPAPAPPGSTWVASRRGR